MPRVERVTGRRGKDLEDFAAAIIHSHDPLLTDRMISASPGYFWEERELDCLKWGSDHKYEVVHQTICHFPFVLTSGFNQRQY